MTSALNPKGSRYNSLQILRALAALMVVVRHVTQIFDPALTGMSTYHPGANGVEIFFVLSGFVIFVTSERLHGSAGGWKVFAARRVIRVVPMYWLLTLAATAATVAVRSLMQTAGHSSLWIACSFLFLPAHNPAGLVAPVLSVGWTLNFEMFFYFLFAVALALRANVIIFVAAVLLPLSAAQVLFSPGSATGFYCNAMVLNFLAGMVIARLCLRRHMLPTALALPVALVCLVLLCGFTVFSAWRPLFVGLEAMGLVWSAVSLERLVSKTPAWVLLLADASYVLYLSHELVIRALQRVAASLFATRPWTIAPMCVLCAILVAVCLRLWIEAPLQSFLRLRFERPINHGRAPAEAQGAGVEG